MARTRLRARSRHRGRRSAVEDATEAAPGAVPAVSDQTRPAAPSDAGAGSVEPKGNRSAPIKQSRTGKRTPADTREKTKPTVDSVGSLTPAGTGSTKGITPMDTAAEAAHNADVADKKNGATDRGVTKDSIKLGSVAMFGMALGNLIITPAPPPCAGPSPRSTTAVGSSAGAWS